MARIPFTYTIVSVSSVLGQALCCTFRVAVKVNSGSVACPSGERGAERKEKTCSVGCIIHARFFFYFILFLELDIDLRIYFPVWSCPYV